MAFAHLGDGLGVLCNAAAGFVVANEEGFVATTLELLFKFVEVKRAAPLVLELFDVAKLAADVGHSLTEFSIGWDEDKVVVSETVGDDHFHRSRAASGDDDDLVAVFAGPRL